jgi:hypothetical protein
MPGGDGTGPLGRGPMTGGGFGFCAGFSHPGYTNPGIGRGLGRGGGRGFRRVFYGRGRGFFGRPYYQDTYYPTVQSREEEKTYLENMVKGLEEEISSIRERIKNLSKEKKENP